MPKVSVIIPTYNRARYIREAIDSVLAQTYRDYEIVIVDDGSADGTKKIVKGYIEKYPKKIRYFYQENGGEAAARNKGIKRAKGDYIAFLDSDDFWLPEKLKIQVECLDSNAEMAANYCCAKRIDQRGDLLDIKPSRAALLAKDFLDGKRVPMTALVRKACFKEIGLFDENIKVGEDTDMWLRLSLKYKIHFLDNPLAIIRSHDENISNSEEEMYQGHIKIIEKLVNGKTENSFDKKYLLNLLARNYYLLSRSYFHTYGASQSVFKYLLKAIKINPLIGKCFIKEDEPLFFKIKRVFNPYGMLLFNCKKKYAHKKNSKPTNILFYEPSSGFGGSGNASYNLVSHLDRNKYHPVFITLNDGPQFEKVKELGDQPIRLNLREIEPNDNTGVFSYLKFGFDLLFNIIPVSIKLAFIIKKNKIGLTHINTNIISGIPAIIASKVSRVPSLCHIRQTRKLVKREKIFARWVNEFILLNRDAKEILKNDIPEEKLNIVYDGINLDEFAKVKSRCFRKELDLDSSPVVGLVGRIVKGKGHKEFILAAKEVLQIKPDVKFVIVGDAKGGDGRYYREVKELVEKENLSDTIIFTGWRNDVKNIISDLNILAQTATSSEGFGLTCVEAMALRKPVIATNIPGPTEIVVDGETGLLVPPNNPDALAEAVLKLLNNPNLAKQMGEAGRKRAEKLFDIHNIVKKIEEVYENLL